jgi:hypothetical protein
MVQYANSRSEGQFIAQMASFNYVVVIVPSVYLFYKPIQEQVFENS